MDNASVYRHLIGAGLIAAGITVVMNPHNMAYGVRGFVFGKYYGNAFWIFILINGAIVSI